LSAILGFSNDRQIRMLLDKQSQPTSHQRVVVG
jgi:hypothetical protein